MIDPGVHARSQLALAMSRGMQQFVHDETNRTANLTRQGVQNGLATGFVSLSGPGESVAEIPFPQVFVEKPVFTFGFELGPSSWMKPGDFPVGTGIVTRWITRQFNEMPTWVGAKVAIVLCGIQGPGFMHYQFRGNALSSPTGVT
jgi:hypothetical protein